MAAVLCSGCTSGPSGRSGSPSASVITSTTQVAGAGVLGNQRRPDESCAPQPAGPDAGPSTRTAHNAAGVQPDTAEVPDDPQRIVVLAGDQLDTLCALGLQSRIVGAALPDGSSAQPSYLGTVVHQLPGVGTRSSPNLAAIKAAKPDLILGSQGVTPKLYSTLAAIAPTVFTGTPGAAWEDNLRAVGEATARGDAAGGLIDAFITKAHEDGAAHDATHYQASIVQLTENTVRVYGADNFPASVFAAVGVDRPASQRFTDKPYIELGSTDTDLANHADFSAADADIVYVSFDSPAAKDRAPTLFDSDAWRRLSANRDNRVFVVNNEIWQTGEGLVAARGVIDDMRFVNAPIN
ncbi:iron-siderophore ABC transporter substrate-binding protein [Mycobacterium sp.]|uniref:iron-siderophore ABC transporter substrate-binding protein n=1 Tax=Mycobacterium sp. TaxID=1785 RepID=UPI003F956E77